MAVLGLSAHQSFWAMSLRLWSSHLVSLPLYRAQRLYPDCLWTWPPGLLHAAIPVRPVPFKICQTKTFKKEKSVINLHTVHYEAKSKFAFDCILLNVEWRGPWQWEKKNPEFAYVLWPNSPVAWLIIWPREKQNKTKQHPKPTGITNSHHGHRLKVPEHRNVSAASNMEQQFIHPVGWCKQYRHPAILGRRVYEHHLCILVLASR